MSRFDDAPKRPTNPATELRRPVASAAEARAEVQDALDTLFGAC